MHPVRPLTAVLVVVLVGCAGGTGDEGVEASAAGAELVEMLEPLDYFVYLDSESVARVKGRIRSVGWDALFDEGHRLFHADSENLAEGGVEDFLRSVEPFLERQGVTLSSVASSFEPRSYTVDVNGRTVVIWNTKDDARDDSEPGWIWGVASLRTLNLLNTLLVEAGSPERAYAVNGGNDLAVFFLTEPLHDAIVSHPDTVRGDSPYVMTEEYPWFGQPQ